MSDEARLQEFSLLSEEEKLKEYENMRSEMRRYRTWIKFLLYAVQNTNSQPDKHTKQAFSWLGYQNARVATFVQMLNGALNGKGAPKFNQEVKRKWRA